MTGTLPVATDPGVEQVGADVGHAPQAAMLRAPDLSVGGVEDKPGWATSAPLLAIEYADIGTDEADLRSKIVELLAAGTRYVWVVRLVGPRRVEVHSASGARTFHGGETLTAQGALKNPVPVDALFDRDAAFRVALTNLLQRQGYADLDDVLARGRAEGRAEGESSGLARAVLMILAQRGLKVSARDRSRVLACTDARILEGWVAKALTAESVEALVGIGARPSAGKPRKGR